SCLTRSLSRSLFGFFFNDTATSEIYTLSLHDALPILMAISANPLVRDLENGIAFAFKPIEVSIDGVARDAVSLGSALSEIDQLRDRKSTRLNSSHVAISYAVFCLKKKKHTPVLYHLIA